MQYLFSIIVCVFGLHVFHAEHAFHASVAELNVNSENQSLELTIHVFIDDLELALSEAGFDSLYIATSKESPLADSLINMYIQDHLYIDIKDQPIQFNFLGREMSDDLAGLWCYFEAEEVNPDFQEMLMHNSILLAQFDDQRNICRVFKGRDQKHMLFRNGKEEAAFKF